MEKKLMNRDEQEETTIYKVVVNHEEQYSIWPADRENPLGWKDVGKSGTKAECLAHIKEVWTDMRPLSLRKKMEGTRERDPRAPRRPGLAGALRGPADPRARGAGPRVRRHRARARARALAPGSARRRALDRARLRRDPLAAGPRLAARPTPPTRAAEARSVGARAAAPQRVPDLLPRPRAALRGGGRGGEHGAAEVAHAGPGRVRQRGAALAHPRERGAAAARLAGRGRGRALVVPGLARGALDRAIRRGRGRRADGREQRAAGGVGAHQPAAGHAGRARLPAAGGERGLAALRARPRGPG